MAAAAVGRHDSRARRLLNPEIVEKSGWDYFRDLESQVVAEAAKKDSCIIDTGGGVILRQQNVDHLKQNGLLFWLKADPDTIISRIKDDANRPSLTGNKSFIEEVQEVLQQRTPLYQQAQDVTIETAGRTIDSIADEIVEKYNKRIQKPQKRQTGQEVKRQRDLNFYPFTSFHSTFLFKAFFSKGANHGNH